MPPTISISFYRSQMSVKESISLTLQSGASFCHYSRACLPEQFNLSSRKWSDRFALVSDDIRI